MEAPKTFSGISFSEVDHMVNADDKYLFCRYWKPQKEIKALLFIVHGYAEHCGRYEELAKRLMEIGVLSFAHDHVAHGESQGIRGYITDYTILIRDMWQHVDLMKAKYPDIPMFIFGHSMGGGLALLAASERPTYFGGILLSSPYILPIEEIATPFKIFLLNTACIIFPKLRILKLKPEYLSRDQNELETHKNDPLIDHDGMRAVIGMQLLQLSDKLREISSTQFTSMFIAHSEDDQICDIRGTKYLLKESKTEDLTSRIYKDAKHMLLHETPEFVKEYHEEIAQWIRERF